MSLIAKAEIVTVDDLEFTIEGHRVSWTPPVERASAAWKVERSMAILTDRLEKLGRVRDALERLKAAKK